MTATAFQDFISSRKIYSKESGVQCTFLVLSKTFYDFFHAFVLKVKVKKNKAIGVNSYFF